MFVSDEKYVGKKAFQKPNILRRKLKISNTQMNTCNVNESPGTNHLITLHVIEPGLSDPECTKETVSYEPPITKTSVINWSVVNNNLENNDVNTPRETETEANIQNSYVTTSNITQTEGVCVVRNTGNRSLNIDTFLNNKSTSSTNIDATMSPERKVGQRKAKWSFDVSEGDTNVMMHNYVSQLADTERKSETVVGDGEVPSVILTSVNQLSKQSHEFITTAPNRTVSVELISNRAVKFKCDEIDCNKGFWSEERLRKHKNSHNRQTSARPPSQMSIECPVKKVLGDGVEEKCPRTFQVRRELLEHLNTDHTPDDALHRCEVCGRRFFWASGLRAHAQSVCARGGLACAWPGCARVFRLPCRLREHARAHTGDRPYRCCYPECGWAFRSASKLVRHARRHSDERRHLCGACGRAFLRREHLRDHAARHRLPAARSHHRCTHAGCEQSFTNMSTLYMHMKKVHKKCEGDSATPAITDQTVSVVETGDNIYLASVTSDSGPEWQAARTHCTWPLSRAPAHEPAYGLEEDVQVESAEGAASNVYTVRSDLFLHGNVPIDEDSQNIVAEITDSSEATAPLDADLCLDSHPTIDLMPEGLMYEDAAVDESSFRVLLMNGEELTM